MRGSEGEGVRKRARERGGRVSGWVRDGEMREGLSGRERGEGVGCV